MSATCQCPAPTAQHVALSSRRAAAAVPLLSARHRRRCAAAFAVAAGGSSPVCPVGMGAAHAVEPPGGLPNTKLRPVSDLTVSSSKALEAFRASGVNRARPARRPCRPRGACILHYLPC